MDAGERSAVLVAAAGAAWEPLALRLMGTGADGDDGLVVVKRCVDLADLLATAATGQGDVAVVAADLPGLDASAVLQLLRHDVRTVAVGAEGVTSLRRIGVAEVVPDDAVTTLPEACRRAVVRELVDDPEEQLAAVPPAEAAPGRVVAVWGPAGAPGRTTVAVGLAAELALRRTRVVLADLDPYAGAVAQSLGVLDEVSGLLAAARLANAGELDQRRFAATRRSVGDHLEVLTGLPRADRWVEVRDGITGEVLELAAAHASVVADTGFSLEDADPDFGHLGAGRNRMTLETVALASEVVVVGSADPLGLSRLARGLVELGDAVPGVRQRVVVNRMRESLGWSEADITGMVEGFARPVGVHFLPDDRAACDRASVEGRALTEVGESALRSAVAGLCDVVFPESVVVAERHGRRRRVR